MKSSTGVKEVYLNDIAIQYYIASGTGIEVAKASLVHIDSSYVRGEAIDVQRLFAREDLTKAVVDKQPFVAAELKAMQRMLGDGTPNIDIGPQCYTPYACSFRGHCWAHIPSPSVFDFADTGKPDGFKYYRQGVVKMEDVPRNELGWRQQLQYDGTVHKKNAVNTKAIRVFLDSLWYPLVFMDFETTCMTPVPLFNGTRPFQPVPFQYSLHMMNSPEDQLRHSDYLGGVAGDPRREFIATLLDVIPEGSCVVTWNKAFERRILQELANQFPEYKMRIQSIIDNMVDLMVPFRSKHIYHWRFEGSYSIKSVLPALAPELSYESMSISDGEIAAESWLRMRTSSDPVEQEQIKLDLLEYCHLDTQAMVRILEKMQEIVDNFHA